MKHLFFVILFLSCLALAGCGGGGGGDNGITLTPQQQEFADVVYAFAAAVNEKDKERAMGLVMSTLSYNQTYGYNDFKNRLENFIDKAENIDFKINDIGVSLTLSDLNDELAEIRASVSISYNTNEVINEILEINVEKSGTGSNKGITLFQKYSNEASAFPPVLE